MKKAATRGAMILGILFVSEMASRAQDPSGRAGQPRGGQQQPGQQAQGSAATSAHNDGRIARWLLLGNQKEVDAGMLAKEKSSNAEVKQFAEMMIADHQKVVAKLKQLIGDKGGMRAYPPKTSGGTLQDNTPDRSRTGVVVQDDGRSRDGKLVARDDGQNRNAGATSTRVDFLQLKEELAEKCKSDMKDAMENLSGEEFDKVYVSHQLLGHKEMLETLKAVRSSASSEFQQAIDRDMQTVQMHLDHAKKLCDQICKKR